VSRDDDPGKQSGNGVVRSEGAEVELVPGAEPVPRTQWELFRRRFFRHKAALISLIVLAFMCLVTFGANFVAPHGPNEQDILLGAVSPSAGHWFGTDDLGRDQLSEILYAGRISLKIGLTVALISTVAGTAIGALAGFFGKLIDQLLSRITDLFLIIPSIALLAIALKKFGTEDTTIILVLAGLGWTYVARVVRGQVLAIKEKEFVEAARASGASGVRIIVRHIVPNIVGPIMVNATLGVAGAIVAESSLSFLGFGIQPPQSSWGRMLADAEPYVDSPDKAHLLYFPGLMLLIVVLAVNFLGDGLRDAFDPQSEHG